MDEVILVDKNDEVVGIAPKLEAHITGALHRAFSVLIFSSKGKLLIHQRALDKYHSPGLWTNTCCSHPSPNESVSDAAKRRLWEEMGLNTPLMYVFKFTYKHLFENGLTEHEIDHVLVGFCDDIPSINPAEVHAYKYVYLDDVKKDITINPDLYTIWFKIIIGQYSDRLVNFQTQTI